MANAPARWDLEVGWISVGSGLGGTCSAIAAHDAGGEAGILEKAPKLGGLSGYGAGEGFVPNNRWMRELGIEDNDEDGRAYLGFVAGGFAPDLANSTAAKPNARYVQPSAPKCVVFQKSP